MTSAQSEELQNDMKAEQINTLLSSCYITDQTDRLEEKLVHDFIFGKTNVAIAARQLLEYLSTSSTSSFVTASSIYSDAVDFPFLQHRLVDLLVGLKDAAKSNTSFEPVVDELLSDMGRTDMLTWQHAKMFAEYSPTEADIAEYHNFNQFHAIILAHPQAAALRLVSLHHALFVICGALEDLKDTSHSNPDIDVPAAAHYVIHAGEVIHSGSLNNTPNHLALRGSEWHGEDGFSLPRWLFWKARLQEIAQTVSDMSVTTKDAARVVYESMNVVEEVAALRVSSSV